VSRPLYVKHRSIGLDLLLLAETAGLLTIGRAIGAQPPIAAADWVPALPVVVPAADDVKVAAIADAAEATP
jgi:hypothetical protein